MNEALDLLLADLTDASSRRRLAETLGCTDSQSATQTLERFLELPIDEALLSDCLKQLVDVLPTSPNPERGLANLVRYIEAARSPQGLLTLFERDSLALPTLMRILATSQSWAEQLIIDPESFDLLRLTEGLPVSREILVDELANEVLSRVDPQLVARSLKSHRLRELMRIAFGDFIGALPIETVTKQLTILAEAILETAVAAARRESLARFGVPLTATGQPARFAVLGYGKLGGNELSYAHDLQLMFVSDSIQTPQSPRGGATHDYFERVAKRVLQLISDDAGPSAEYVVSTDPRAQGPRGPVCTTIETAVRYYENQGQTWERQAFIKARHVAGDASLSAELLEQLEPWVYRRYLSRADITEIAALKRHLGKRLTDPTLGPLSINDQPGGVRDVEFLIQYLQLLYGGELVELRAPNTLEAIAALERVGCLTAQERRVLDENYRFLRQMEHRLQIVFGSSTERLPESDAELKQFVLASGFQREVGQSVASALQEELESRMARNTRIVNHLLNETFTSDSADAAPESDLILAHAPDIATVHDVLARYGFTNPQAAYVQLTSLGQEQVSFLSSRRCRHFLAAIVPALLQAISATPAPDHTLENLNRMSASLGGKAVLWELFQANPAAMNLCLRLCATSPYLVGILTSNPGMIDELIDSLMLDRLPSTAQIETLLSDLCRGVDEPSIILQSFKNSMHLKIGVRDVLSKDEIVDTHRALSDVAEACLKQVIEREYHRLVQRLGVPIVVEGDRIGQPAELVVLAVGKLGGREPNYHSDLEVLFLFDAEGSTQSLLPQRRHEPISNRQFFNQLGQKVVKAITRVGAGGHLYELDARLRPLVGGVGGAVTLRDLTNYFEHGPAQLWERQSLCKARPVWASTDLLPQVVVALRGMLTSLPWRTEYAADIQRHRLRLENGAAAQNIKRGPGGTLDIEFTVQMLQLQNASTQPSILVPRTVDAITQLRNCGLLSKKHANALGNNYRWLRRVESGLRLMNLPARHELPTSQDELDQLQFLLQMPEASIVAAADQLDGSPAHVLIKTCRQIQAENRGIFETIFQAACS